MEWKNIYRGIIMGASDVVPGVSGGTIAVLLGIYDQLIAAINGLFSKDWKRHVRFLLPLGMGIVIAIFTIAHVLDWLLENHPGPTYFFFLGLIIGIIPYLFREAEVRRSFKIRHYILLVIGILLVTSLILIGNPDQGGVITDRSLSIYILLFFSGFLGSAAMVLPGISGSFILLVIGVYYTVINSIKNLELGVIIVTGLGIFIGIITMSKIIHYFLSHFRTSTFAVIIGLVIGSIFVIFPGWPMSGIFVFISILTFSTGLLVAYILGKVEYEEK